LLRPARVHPAYLGPLAFTVFCLTQRPVRDPNRLMMAGLSDAGSGKTFVTDAIEEPLDVDACARR
jgi:hypothetical protein